MFLKSILKTELISYCVNLAEKRLVLCMLNIKYTQSNKLDLKYSFTYVQTYIPTLDNADNSHAQGLNLTLSVARWQEDS